MISKLYGNCVPDPLHGTNSEQTLRVRETYYNLEDHSFLFELNTECGVIHIVFGANHKDNFVNLQFPIIYYVRRLLVLS